MNGLLIKLSFFGMLGLTALAHAGTFRINSSAWNNVRDGNLTLPEAAKIAGDGIGCLTQGERNQISGCNIITEPPSASCVYNPLSETRYRLDPVVSNCGLSHSDSITFENAVTQVNPSSSLELWDGDGIDGLLSNGSVVRFTGPGASGWVGPAIKLAAPPASTSGQFRNLQITEFNGDGINLIGTDGAIFEALEIYGNTGDGISLGPNFTETTQVKATSIGSADGSRPNYIYSNGGFGIRITDQFNDGTDRLNRIRSSYIGFKNGNLNLDSGNALGGIQITDNPGSRIGGFSEVSRLYIGWNNGPGLRLVGTNSKFNTVAGATIGLTPSGTAAPNAYGVELDGGAHDNLIGLVGESQINVISGNSNEGIRFLGNNDANRIEQNIIGLTFDRLTLRANGFDGIGIGGGSDQTSIHQNVIVGNARFGIYVENASGLTITGNAIGVRGTGTTANDVLVTPNQSGGIRLQGVANASINTGNVIAGNGGNGIWVNGAASNGLAIHGNRIGLDGAGNAAANSGDGILVEQGPDQIDIGTGTVGTRNLIGSNTGDGIDINGDSVDVSIIGNFVGTESTGNVGRGNGGNGIFLRNGVDHSLVQNNVTSANSGDGIKLSGDVDNVQVLGNLVGINFLKSAALGNAQSGIAMVDGANNNRVGSGSSAGANIVVGNNTGIFVAGTGATGNVIDFNQIGYEGTVSLPLTLGNAGSGVLIGSGANSTVVANNAIIRSGIAGVDLSVADNCEIRGNRIGIGLVPAINTAQPNGRGIRLLGGASNTVIGGATASTDRNIIANSTLYGIGLFNAGTDNNTILNNWIGIGILGSGDFGNGTEGVLIQETASNNTVVANVISGNQSDGIRIRQTGTVGNVMQRNLIGTDSAGTGQVPNGGAGIRIEGGASQNLSGFLVGQGNTIRFNNGDGIWIESGVDNGVSLNTIDTNGGLAIDLGTDGVTANDAIPDLDVGANNLQNFPVLSAVSRASGMVSFTATLNSAGNKTYGLQVYRNLTCDPSGHGELETNLGSGSLVVPASGTVSSNFMMPLADNVPATWLTGVVNDGDNSSEVSACASMGTLGDVLFRNGFEDNALVVSDRGKATLAGWQTERLDDGRVRISWSQSARQGLDALAHAWQIASARAVRVDSIAATGGACQLAGAIACAIPAGHEPLQIELVLAADADAYLGIVLQRSGRPVERHWIAP